MDETDVRKLYQEYIRMLAGAVLAYPEWKRTLLELPIGRRFAINAASLTWLNKLIRAVEECSSKGVQMPAGLAWIDEARRQGVRVEQLRVVVFKGSDAEPASEPNSPLRFWFGAGPGGPRSWDQPDSAENECWYTLQSVEFPDIKMEFGVSA
jgi:hypothetical protein